MALAHDLAGYAAGALTVLEGIPYQRIVVSLTTLSGDVRDAEHRGCDYLDLTRHEEVPFVDHLYGRYHVVNKLRIREHLLHLVSVQVWTVEVHGKHPLFATIIDDRTKVRSKASNCVVELATNRLHSRGKCR